MDVLAIKPTVSAQMTSHIKQAENSALETPAVCRSPVAWKGPPADSQVCGLKQLRLSF
jgi:hypothetical protein